MLYNNTIIIIPWGRMSALRLLLYIFQKNLRALSADQDRIDELKKLNSSILANCSNLNHEIQDKMTSLNLEFKQLEELNDSEDRLMNLESAFTIRAEYIFQPLQ